jgi:hypothetical protein
MKALLAVAVFSMLWATSCDEPASSPTREQPTQQAQAPVVVTPPRPELPIPADEHNFITAVQRGQSAFRAAPNEMAQGGTRSQRRAAICQNLSGVSVLRWVGQIEKLSSNSDGKGVLEIAVAPGVHVKTWNNDLSDSFGSANTLIDPSSPLFAVVSQMKQGDEVLFSGTFFPSTLDCVREGSVTLEGSMTDPEFIFRYASVSAAGTTPQ